MATPSAHAPREAANVDLCRKTQASKLREKPRLRKNPELRRPANYTDQPACAHTPRPRDKRKTQHPTPHLSQNQPKTQSTNSRKTQARENQRRPSTNPWQRGGRTTGAVAGGWKSSGPVKALQQTLEESPYTSFYAGPPGAAKANVEGGGGGGGWGKLRGLASPNTNTPSIFTLGCPVT